VTTDRTLREHRALGSKRRPARTEQHFSSTPETRQIGTSGVPRTQEGTRRRSLVRIGVSLAHAATSALVRRRFVQSSVARSLEADGIDPRSPEPPVIGCAVSETASQRLRPASTQQVVQIAGYQSGRTKNCRRRYGAGGRKPVGPDRRSRGKWANCSCLRHQSAIVRSRCVGYLSIGP